MNPSFGNLVSTHWLTLAMPFIGGIVAAFVTHAIRNWVSRSSRTATLRLWQSVLLPSLSRRYGKTKYTRKLKATLYVRPRRQISPRQEKDDAEGTDASLRHN